MKGLFPALDEVWDERRDSGLRVSRWGVRYNSRTVFVGELFTVYAESGFSAPGVFTSYENALHFCTVMEARFPGHDWMAGLPDEGLTVFAALEAFDRVQGPRFRPELEMDVR